MVHFEVERCEEIRGTLGNTPPRNSGKNPSGPVIGKPLEIFFALSFDGRYPEGSLYFLRALWRTAMSLTSLSTFIRGAGPMKNKRMRNFFTSIVFATIVAFGVHILIQGWEDRVAQSYSHIVETAKNVDKTSFLIISVAGLTAFFPVALSYWLLAVLWDRVPGEKWWVKGLSFSAILLILKNSLIRAPIMEMVMGIPPWLVAAGQLDVWVPNILLGLFLAFGVYKTKCVTP